MTAAQYARLIDRLCSRGFPAERGPSGLGLSGPGYHTACLSHDDEGRRGDAADRLARRAQCLAEHEALLELLGRRWGEPRLVSLWSAQARFLAGDAIPDPWAEFALGFDFLHLWRVEGHWIAVGMALDENGPGWELSVAVTEVAPP
ncbi:hypothetical protein [Streptomyces sp. NPDC050504]|uniref:hypothetical protein n=1 Tax=Streptomyces sp. NPDC050504 TaxID=3365618 RepID=UPI0037996956